MDNQSIERILAQSRELKSLPESVHELNRLMQDNKATMSEISDIVSADPVLSAKILKSVNSPFYGFPSRIETIAYAVSILGIDSIRYLAISNAVISKFSTTANSLVPIDSFWRHSFATAIIAQQLAKMRNHKNTERMFTSGLLHELGTLLLAIAIPNEYRAVISRANSEQVPLYQAEQDILGFCHTDCQANRALQEDSAILNIADSVASSTYPSIRLVNMDLSIKSRVWKIADIQPHQLNEVLDELDNMVESAMKGMFFEVAA